MAKIVGWVSIGCLMVVSLAYYYCFNSHILLSGAAPVKLDIKRGMSAKKVYQILAGNQLVVAPKAFYLLIRLSGSSGQIQAGQYQLEVNMTPWRFLMHLRHGDVMQHKLTLIEGWNFQQMRAKIDHLPYITHQVTGINQKKLVKVMGLKLPVLEGALYPTTYFYTQGVSDLALYRRAFERMENILHDLWEHRAEALPYKRPYDVLIIASLIERESKFIPEQPMIAAVIVNRLKKSMRLQIDAAVLYGLNRHSGTLTRADLKKKTPYNLYKRHGLPPTPIAMPGISAIYAALHPAITSALYYVLDEAGRHHFTDNYQLHLKAVQRLRQRQKKNVR